MHTFYIYNINFYTLLKKYIIKKILIYCSIAKYYHTKVE